MDLRNQAGVKWLRNMRRKTPGSPLDVRPGLGQRAQIDSTTAMSNDDSTLASGGHTKILGSFVYRSNFGHRQILTLLNVRAVHSDANDWDMLATTGVSTAYLQAHGSTDSLVLSIFDLTTNNVWEELLPFKTSELGDHDDLHSKAGHFETHRAFDKRVFKSEVNGFVNFEQIADSVFFGSPDLGMWVYRGIDVPSHQRRQRICADNPDPVEVSGAPRRSNNNHNGYSEGSVVSPVTPTRGLNGEDVVYLTKGDMPRSVGMAAIGGRMAYTNRDVVWFSDVNQPGAVMASNFAAFQADGQAAAIASFQDKLFVFSEIEVHSFTLRPVGAAGVPVPGVIDVVRVDTSKEAGCVSARSHCETPVGICFVSTWGIHLVSQPNQIVTISDPISDHWGEGLMDPASGFNQNAGAAGAAAQRQNPIRYAHSGSPSVDYDASTRTIYVCYETHVLVFQVSDKSWGIWPLGSKDNNSANPIGHIPSFTGQAIVSDLDSTYLISGLYDLDSSISSNPYNESTSYSITELGFGGGKDRTIVCEDMRNFGNGRWKLLEPTESFAGGAPPALMSATTADVQNGWLAFVTLVDEWFEYDNLSTQIKKKSYDIDFWVMENRPWPHTSLKVKLNIGGTWQFATIGSHPESGTRGGFVFSIPGLGTELHVTTPSYGGAAQNRLPCRLPLVRFVVEATATTAEDPEISLLACEATYHNPATGLGTDYSVRALIWQQSDRFKEKNIKWDALYTGAVVGGQVDPNYSIDGASKHERDIEWALCTGIVGGEDGARHRIRDIRAELETGGPDERPAGDWAGLYNVRVASDYKMLSGQRQDLVDPYVADRDALQKNTIRDRMSNGKRNFGGVAEWSTGTGISPAADTDYLIDEPEVNEIAVSTHAKGDSVMAMIFGRASSIGTFLRIHRLSAFIQSAAANRRKGR
jgi:hypothetical protein